MKQNFKNLIARFAKDQSGATAIEYGLIVAGITVAIILIVYMTGARLEKFSFGRVNWGFQQLKGG